MPSTSITLTKWYIDTLVDDGSVLLVYLGEIRAGPLALARATVELFSPDGRSISCRARGHALETTARGARLGDVSFDDARLTFETPRLSGDLSFVASSAPIVPLAPFIARGERTLSWTVEVPDAHVSGALVVDGAPRAITGRGYRDRVSTDLAPWRLPIRNLTWGRAVGGPHHASWVTARLDDGAVRAARFVDDTVTVGVGDVPPEVSLDDGRVLLSARVTAQEALAVGTLRALGRLAYGDPVQEKRAGRARVCGAHGFAIWEQVRFSGDARGSAR